jgi:hypothetical protein
MEVAEKIKETIDQYMSTAGISEDELYLGIQMDFDDEDNEFTIEYLLDSISEEKMRIGTTFRYETLAEAWENYLNQLPEMHQTFPNAEIGAASPGEYSAGKLGGNPVMSIPDA